MESGYVVKTIAWLLSLIGASGLIAGLLGFFGHAILGINPWLLFIGGFMIVLSGFGLMTVDIEDEVQ